MTQRQMRARYGTNYQVGDTVWYQPMAKDAELRFEATVLAPPRRKGRHWLVRLLVESEAFRLLPYTRGSRLVASARCTRVTER